ncbi:MAG TPA: DUF6265 family protein [Xanthomonadaceae bacterium]|nr:DUF6265 family protein [Xanthomonadaceae bacterium]
MTSTFAAASLLLASTSLSTAPDLSWLTGCWRSEDGNATEVWSPPYDGHHFGYGATLAEGELVFFEQLRIETDETGTRYVASPAGIPPTVFTATEIDAGSAVFTNPEHDYPQRISYRRDRDTLTAEIALTNGSKSQSFRWRRCPDGHR